MSQFTNFTEAEMSAAAGADPWKLNQELQAGKAGAINDLADAFYQSGMHVKEADDEFATAKKRFKDAYRVDDSEHPINESNLVKEASTALAGHPEELSRIAVNLEQVAAALATAQRDCDAEIAALDAKLHQIDDDLTAARTNPEFATMIAQGADEVFLHAAREATKVAVEQIQTFRGAYQGKLNEAEASMLGAGDLLNEIDDMDGVAGNAPMEIAQRYEQSGQRARDQELVDKARAEGRTGFYLANASSGPGTGSMTQKEGEALARLRDYTTITDPAHDYRHSLDERDEASQLAGQRLDDYMVANSTGPVPKDPVLGGDARTRAQARLQLQHDIENGQLSWHQNHTFPDEATQLMNELEARDRAQAIAGLQNQLQAAGMSEAGAVHAADSMSRGIIPPELVEGASAAGKPIAAGERAFNLYADRVPVDDWKPNVNPYSAGDVEALRNIGGKLGVAGNIIDIGVGVYELNHGAPFGEVAAKTGGGMAGAWALGALGAQGGAVVAGPPGAFLGALVLGTVGGVWGEDAGERVYEWASGK